MASRFTYRPRDRSPPSRSFDSGLRRRWDPPSTSAVRRRSRSKSRSRNRRRSRSDSRDRRRSRSKSREWRRKRSRSRDRRRSRSKSRDRRRGRSDSRGKRDSRSKSRERRRSRSDSRGRRRSRSVSRGRRGRRSRSRDRGRRRTRSTSRSRSKERNKMPSARSKERDSPPRVPARRSGEWAASNEAELAAVPEEDPAISVSERFHQLEVAAGYEPEALTVDMSLEDISVVIERNLPTPTEPVVIRHSFEADTDSLVVPRGPNEGVRCVFDRPELKPFRHDAVLDDEGYVETRKVVRRVEPAIQVEPRIKRQFDFIRDFEKTLQNRRSDDDKKDRPRPARPSSRSGSHRDRRERRPDRDLPDFSQRPNKGFLEPRYRNPTEIPRHQSYFLHDDRDRMPDARAPRGRGAWSGPDGGPWRSAARWRPRGRPLPLEGGSRGSSEGRGRADVDTWKHDKFEEIYEGPTSTTNDDD